MSRDPHRRGQRGEFLTYAQMEGLVDEAEAQKESSGPLVSVLVLTVLSVLVGFAFGVGFWLAAELVT